MKKIMLIFLIIILLVGCSKKNEVTKSLETKNDEMEPIISEPKEDYIDTNPIKIAFYKGSNGLYKRLDKYDSSFKEYKEIGIFSIILSNDEEVNGSSIKSLYKEISGSIPNFNDYKTGFNLKFTLEDGTIVDENFYKPLGYGSYPFSNYLYVWIYDDVNTTGWHSHIEENDYNENTIMSSVKLMWAPYANLINSPIEFTVFTYKDSDFDENNHYRGISKWTTIINK